MALIPLNRLNPWFQKRFHIRLPRAAFYGNYVRSEYLPWYSDDSWTPASLFADGEQGVWYDPSDLSTLFQDHLGTIPAAYGQPVGLMLDKSKGLTANADERMGLGSPVLFGEVTRSSYDPVTGQAVVHRGDSVGQLATVSFSITNHAALHRLVLENTGNVRLQVRRLDGVILANIAAGETSDAILIPNGSTLRISPGENNSTGAFTVRSLREVLGNHASQPTVTARPTLMQDAGGRAYLDFDGVDDTLLFPGVPLTSAYTMAFFHEVAHANGAVFFGGDFIQSFFGMVGAVANTYMVQIESGFSTQYRTINPPTTLKERLIVDSGGVVFRNGEPVPVIAGDGNIIPWQHAPAKIGSRGLAVPIGFMAGKMFEALILTRRLTDGEAAQLGLPALQPPTPETPTPEPAPPPTAVTIAPINADNWLTSIGKEQSLGLGANTGQSVDPDGNTNAKTWAAALHGGKALMLTGLKRADGVNQTTIHGPMAVGYDASVPATGEVLVANANMGNAPVAYLILCELSRRGLFDNQFVPMFTNAAGLSILQLDDDLPTQTGTGVTTFYESFVFTFQQIAARAAANSKQARALFDVLIQGEAEASAAPGVWLDGYREVDKDQRAALVASGYTASDTVIPKLIFQTGGYVNGAALDHNVSLEQLRVVRESGAIFAGPISQFLVADNTVHPNLAEYARMATLGAWAFEENYHGRGFNLLSASHEVIGNTVVIRYPMRPGEDLRSINDKFDAYGGNPFGGFEVTGGATIVSAAPSETIPGAMVVTLDRPAAGLGKLTLGRQKKDMRAFAVGTSNYGSQRVGWAGTHTSTSLIWPGAVAERVLPSEEWTT